MCNSFQKCVHIYVEEFLSVVWMAPLLTQTWRLWVALSVLLYFNRLTGTRDENNFLLVYLRDSYSNYGNLTRPNFHIFSVSSLIRVLSLHFTAPFHQPKYHIQAVWWMRRIKTENYQSKAVWEFKSDQPLVYFCIITDSQHCFAITYQEKKKKKEIQDDLKFSLETK